LLIIPTTLKKIINKLVLCHKLKTKEMYQEKYETEEY